MLNTQQNTAIKDRIQAQPRTQVSMESQQPQSTAKLPAPELIVDEDFAERLEGFIKGELTWAEVEGWTVDQLYYYAQMGVDLMQCGRLDDAEQIFDACYAINPKDWYFSYCLGHISLMKNATERAVAFLEISIATAPVRPEPFLILAAAKTRLGQQGDAQKLLARALQVWQQTQADQPK